MVSLDKPLDHYHWSGLLIYSLIRTKTTNVSIIRCHGDIAEKHFMQISTIENSFLLWMSELKIDIFVSCVLCEVDSWLQEGSLVVRWCQCGVFDNRSWHQDYTTQTIRVKTKHNKLNLLIIIVFVILIRSLAHTFDQFKKK